MALDVGQAEIENDQIRRLAQQLERGLAVRRFEDLIAVRAQAHAQQFADRRLVIDDQDTERGGAHAAASRRCNWSGIGSVMVNTAPLRSGRLAAVIVPCMASTKPRRDREAEPGAGAHVIGLLHAVELVEDAFQVALRNAVALVEDLQDRHCRDRASCA